jgi:hypothetical protein
MCRRLDINHAIPVAVAISTMAEGSGDGWGVFSMPIHIPVSSIDPAPGSQDFVANTEMKSLVDVIW